MTSGWSRTKPGSVGHDAGADRSDAGRLKGEARKREIPKRKERTMLRYTERTALLTAPDDCGC